MAVLPYQSLRLGLPVHPRPVIEALACGTPVVAFRKGSMPELIDDGKNGFLVNNVDEAIEAVKQVDNIDRQACRDKIEAQFTKERMCQKYIELYERILSHR